MRQDGMGQLLLVGQPNGDFGDMAASLFSAYQLVVTAASSPPESRWQRWGRP